MFGSTADIMNRTAAVLAGATGMHRYRRCVGLRSRRRSVPVAMFDAATNRWADVDAGGAVDRDELNLATFNIWFNDYFAEQRYLAIADLLSQDMPDVMVFQEVTPAGLAVFLAQPWIREHYVHAAATGDELGNYGMLMLSRLPLSRATYTPLRTRLARGFLCAELSINGSAQVICSVHLESGRAASRLRARQLRRIFRALNGAENAVVLGDFNMRDAENDRITPPYCDLWPALRPDDDGFTEDTSINLMRLDSKNKHRHVRFDRVLLKGPGWSATDIDLVGTEPISGAHPRVFPSDHFGVLCRLTRRPAADASQPRRRRWQPWRARPR
jgi:tyrosyl-DNA phosphodiesterase 2